MEGLLDTPAIEPSQLILCSPPKGVGWVCLHLMASPYYARSDLAEALLLTSVIHA